MLLEVGLFPHVSGETPQSAQARVAGYLQFHDGAGCHSQCAAGGATRGAGRGIACMLEEAGATVYCTGRSVSHIRS